MVLLEWLSFHPLVFHMQTDTNGKQNSNNRGQWLRLSLPIVNQKNQLGLHRLYALTRYLVFNQ